MKVSLLRFGQHCGSGQDKAWFSLSFLFSPPPYGPECRDSVCDSQVPKVQALRRPAPRSPRPRVAARPARPAPACQACQPGRLRKPRTPVTVLRYRRPRPAGRSLPAPGAAPRWDRPGRARAPPPAASPPAARHSAKARRSGRAAAPAARPGARRAPGHTVLPYAAGAGRAARGAARRRTAAVPAYCSVTAAALGGREAECSGLRPREIIDLPGASVAASRPNSRVRRAETVSGPVQLRCQDRVTVTCPRPAVPVRPGLKTLPACKLEQTLKTTSRGRRQCGTLARGTKEGVFLAVLLRSSHVWMLVFHILAYSLSLMCSSILVSCAACD